jgi:hypothetical protein
MVGSWNLYGFLSRTCHCIGKHANRNSHWQGPPGYGQILVELAEQATVVSVDASRIAQVSSPDGLFEISAKAILLATGCRERPRVSRLVAGCRPQGIFTIGSLQQLVFKNKHAVGKRAVVVGAEHVAYSAVHMLLSSGTRVEAMVTDFPAHQTVAPVK